MYRQHPDPVGIYLVEINEPGTGTNVPKINTRTKYNRLEQNVTLVSGQINKWLKKVIIN